MLKSVHGLMQQAVTENIFPGGVLMVSRAGRILFHEAYGQANIYTGRKISLNTVFDLASLTKPLASALAVMMLIQENRLDADQTLGFILPGFKTTPKAKIRIRHLLNHTSGLPDYRPYYQSLRLLPYPFRKHALREYLTREPLVSSIGEKTRYSDIGFMVLEWVVELVSGSRLDRYVQKNIYEPLAITDLFFVDLEQPIPDKSYAATEACPWRRLVLNGMVHDDNAYTMGGISGHAGLFGTSRAVHQLLTELLNSYTGMVSPVFQGSLVKLFLKPGSDSERALGFDVPSQENSSSGDLFEKAATVGHLGFTGTSFWMDINRAIVVILLTNRVHTSRMNEQIKAFRPRLHNAVMKCI
ncbi:MAG: serine hydrolase [Desulfosalsimonadaceae bacterium]|nr:serine hydrolase [Desulfosalsimonadaceae bacterium]